MTAPAPTCVHPRRSILAPRRMLPAGVRFESDFRVRESSLRIRVERSHSRASKPDRNRRVPDLSVRIAPRRARGRECTREPIGRIAMMIKLCVAVSMAGVMLSAPMLVSAQDVPTEYQQVLSTLGKQGDFKDNVLKVNIPRNDVKVTVAGVATPTPFGFGGWVAMTKAESDQQVLMGDLVLLQDEINPVMSALLENGLDVTALHNHFFKDEPRMFYMHVHGHGTAADLAQKLKPAIDLIGKASGGSSQPSASTPPPNTLDTAKLVQIVGSPGEQTGAVYKFTLGRNDVKVVEMGATISA